MASGLIEIKNSRLIARPLGSAILTQINERRDRSVDFCNSRLQASNPSRGTDHERDWALYL